MVFVEGHRVAIVTLGDNKFTFAHCEHILQLSLEGVTEPDK
jgi:hypothetical protein